ncbi:hypothetical protein FO519_004197 [Halicephalobus sp. NKZ332]|nr:hypothetical protein FO519_004197 [Halicephalobus sp. NKZ332]
MWSIFIVQLFFLELFVLKTYGKPTQANSVPLSSNSPRLQACGTDLRRLLDWLCTYPNEKLPCYSHFMDESGHHGSKTTKKENPLLLIEKMKTDALAADDYEGGV